MAWLARPPGACTRGAGLIDTGRPMAVPERARRCSPTPWATRSTSTSRARARSPAPFSPKIRDDDWVVGGFNLKLTHHPSADEVWEAIGREGAAGRSEVVFTGLGEPTRRLDVLLDVTRRLVAGGCTRVRVDTDGLASLREGRDVPPLLAAAGVGAVSVSLNAADVRGDLRRHLPEPSRRGRVRRDEGVHPERVRCIPDVAASAVALPGLSEVACRRVAESLGARFRWRPYDRLGRIEGAGPVPRT